MAHQTPSSNRFNKKLELIGLLIAIFALIFTINKANEDKKDTKRQLDNQSYEMDQNNTQIAQQDTQMAFNAQQNQLQSQQLTLIAQGVGLYNQPSGLDNNPDYSTTVTAFAFQSTLIEVTRQAMTTRQVELESTQTAVAQAFLATVIVVRADDIIPQIIGVDGGIEKVLGWWVEYDSGGSNGELNPSSTVVNHNCYGMAWNTNQYGYHRLIIFQKPTSVTFADGGWYIKICVPNNISISSEDLGKIKADWLGKSYGIDNTPWRVLVIQ